MNIYHTFKIILFITLFSSALYIFYKSAKRVVSYILIGKNENRFDSPGQRLKNVFVIAIAQKKLFRDPIAGTIHAFIFWGFTLFLFAIVETIVQGIIPNSSFSFLGPLYTMMTFTQDIFGVIVILGVLASIYRRFILKVERLNVEGHKSDALFILLMILMVVVSMFGQNTSFVGMHGGTPENWEYRPLTAPLANILFKGSASSASMYFEVFWWLHISLVLTFLNYLPHSKHLHVLTSIPNVYFSWLPNKQNLLKPLDLADEKAEYFGVDDVEKFTWKQLFDSFACTECGRCTSVCPAANSGKTLSPRKIITDIRDRVNEKAPILLSGNLDNEKFGNTLLNNYISEEELWQCTTCNACVQECPVMIEHVPDIVDMRRHLVLMDSKFPSELNNTFRSLENNFSPWAFDPSERALWAEGLDIKTMAEDSNTEYLFWVGCAGSYDERYKKVSIAFAKLMQKANIDFRILGTEEKCNGDSARRLGNEYLAQELMNSNIETLNKYNVKKIVTACPHCLNALKNDYKEFGGNYEVIHHSELIEEMLHSGKLKSDKKTEQVRKVTFHDSCYLGRYNDIYEQPREVILNGGNNTLIEMDRNRSKGFCCGAGGGQMFLEDNEGDRINNIRTEEAILTGADTIGTACPFCMTMLTDGVKNKEKTNEISVKDIAEIVLENTL